MPSNTDLFVANESFSVNLDGVNHVVNKGQTRVRAGHPIMKGREMYFEPLTVHYDIETATAKPGEARGAPPVAAPVVEVTPTPDPKPTPVAPTKGLTTDSLKPKTADK